MCPCPVLGLAQQRSAPCVAQARGLLSVYKSRGTLVSLTCARAVTAPRGKACRATAKVLRASLGAIQEQSIQAKETRPRQEELAGKANQGAPRNLPRRATRSDKATRPRQEELAGKTNQGISRPGERQASGRDKMTTTTRRLPWQVTTLYPHSSTSANVSLWGPFQVRVA